MIAILGAAAYLLALVLIAVLFLMTVDRIRAWRRRESPEERLRRIEEFDRRLGSPMWADLERHFGAPVPRDLRELYARPLVRAQNLEIRTSGVNGQAREDFIASFCPADLETISEASWVVKSEFPFANDGFGNYYVVAFGPNPEHPSRVRFHSHEAGDVEEVAESLEDFLKSRTSE